MRKTVLNFENSNLEIGNKQSLGLRAWKLEIPD